MHIQKPQAEKFSIPGGTEGVLYPPSPLGDQSVVQLEMDGKYPQKGYSINDVCTETVLLLEGRFEVEYGDDRFILNPGDMVMLLPKKKYRITGKGKAVVCIAPSWDSKQNHIIEN